MNDSMKTYAILLRPMPAYRKRLQPVPLQADALHSLARSVGVHLLDVVTCQGICNAILLCRALETQAVSQLLEALQGWQTETLLAISHARYDG